MNKNSEAWLHAIVHRMIVRRAAEIHRERGSPPGRDLDNWLQAEAEINGLIAEAETSLQNAAGFKPPVNRCVSARRAATASSTPAA
jgi:hypothetical protein